VVGKPEGNITFERLKLTWEDNIKMDLREIWRVMWTGFIWLTMGISGEML
jgi:hypothetical protein